MPVIQGGHVTEGVGMGEPILNAGAPVNGTNEVDTVATTGTPTGGTFRLKFQGWETVDIAFNAAAATIQSALNALPPIGAAGVVCAGGPLPTGVTVTFSGGNNVPKKNLNGALVLSLNQLTGGASPTVTITRTTPGVDATYRSAPVGAELLDTTNGKAYINTVVGPNVAWVVEGSQT